MKTLHQAASTGLLKSDLDKKGKAIPVAGRGGL
jgi:hypothetical protein